MLLQDIIYNQKKINRLKGQMKQITYLILFISLIVSTQEQTGCYGMQNASKKKCTEYTLTEEEKKAYNADSCCYQTAKGIDYGICIAIMKSEVKDEIKEIEELGGKGVKIQCSSNWLNFGITLVLLVLFF